MSDFELGLSKQASDQSAGIATTIGRYMQEVQGMIFMAKKYPRDTYRAWERIKEACQRKSLAEIAQYEYPRGKERVSGPSIRLAEVLAQNWGNLSYGVVELEQRLGESTAMAFAWDLETNVRSEKIFTVKHERKANNAIVKLTDPRDIHEMVANMGARRVRACILSVIPKDFVDAAEEECEKTLAGESTGPAVDIIRKMLDMFKKTGVTKEMIEKLIGYGTDKFTAKEFTRLQKIYNAIKDGIGKREDYFELAPDEKPEGYIEPETGSLGKGFSKKKEQKESAKDKPAEEGAQVTLEDAANATTDKG